MQIRSNTEKDKLIFTINGRLDCETMGDLWRKAILEIERNTPKQIVVEAKGIDYCDSAGAAFFAELRRRVHGNLEILELADEFLPLIHMFNTKDLASIPAPSSSSIVEEIGRATTSFWRDIYEQIVFTGELVVAMVWAIFNPQKVPWKDTFIIAEKAGVNAFPIVVLVGFLLGLVMAFQSAIPMQKFGAEIFVADLVGISMLKELGPFMTAIILAGRSGSAFAAELGTMKINEEINALITMGVEPIRFLAVTRVLASMFMTPLLAIFCSLAALVGGAIVLLSLGYPLVTYVNRIIQAVSLSAFLAGMFKSIVFAILVAGVGCLRGLQTGTGAKAVGESTTNSVVSSIVLVTFADAIFAVVLYSLGI